MSAAKHTTTVEHVRRRIGTTNNQALAYVSDPDPRLQRLGRSAREALLPELPPLTAGALLGPAALSRHLVASASAGRYRDLFSLWDVFRTHPDDCRPVLAERPQALEKARAKLVKATLLGLRGHADRVAEDIRRADGLIWTWLRELLVEHLEQVAQRPAIASALLLREPELVLPLPEPPGEEWLQEAAALRQHAQLAPAVEALFARHVAELPVTVATLALAHESYPQALPRLVDRVDLDGPEIGSILAWARDHGQAPRLRARVKALVDQAVAADRATGLALWSAWRDRGVTLPLPQAAREATLEGLDLGRPESAALVAALVADGVDLDPQAALAELAARNRQWAEKAYEAFVCEGLDVTLPAALEGNPIVKDGTRCPHCAAWTWVRPGHERRCPHAPAPVS